VISLSERAVEKVKYYAGQIPGAAGKSLRIFMQGGCCPSCQYGFTFDDHQDGDTVIEQGGITVLIDPMSAPYLADATVDFVEGREGAGFVVESPNVVPSCGCDLSPSQE